MAIEISTTKKAAAPVETGASMPALSLRRTGVSAKDRMFFTERLALLLETGGALQPSLLALKEQTDNVHLSAVIGDLSDEVLGGKPFSRALARHPEVFSLTYVNLVGASEQGGFMHRVLTQLQQMEEKSEKLRSTLFAAFSYPAFLLCFSFAVVCFILVVVFPKFGNLFQSIYDQLPITTRFLMAGSDILRTYWIALIAGGAGMLLVVFRWLKSEGGKEVIDRLKLKIPGLKQLFVQVYMIHMLRVMGLSLVNGVSVVDALKSCREVVDNNLFRRFMADIEHGVDEGRGLAAGFEQAAFVPSMVRQMIRTGEESGNLAVVMERIADFYERDLEKKIQVVSKIAEPLMLLVMGVLVGVIVSSLILPIFKLSKAVH